MPPELTPSLRSELAEPRFASVQGAGASAFAAFAAFTLVYILGVIVFGAWVRVSGSGAGCGDHWPTCHGELVPHSAALATRIEFTHRVTSALSGLLALVLPLWARRVFPRGHGARRAAWSALVLVLVEGGIGAGLVLNRWVGSDASAARAIVVALHLVNTLLLTGSTALAATFARWPAQSALGVAWRRAPGLKWLGAGWLGALVLVSAAGAVTALGDTLFVNPAGVPLESPPGAEHFLVQLRVVHPLAACACALLGGGLFWQLARKWSPGVASPRPPLRSGRSRSLYLGCLIGEILLVSQLALGALNIAWSAPAALQLVHLLLAQLVWLCSVLVLRYALDA